MCKINLEKLWWKFLKIKINIWKKKMMLLNNYLNKLIFNFTSPYMALLLHRRLLCMRTIMSMSIKFNNKNISVIMGLILTRLMMSLNKQE